MCRLRTECSDDGRPGRRLLDADVVDAEPAAIVLGGVAVAEEAELGAYPFARAGSETVRLVRKRCPLLSVKAIFKIADSIRNIALPAFLLNVHLHPHVAFAICKR